jgi:uncharacterized protein YjbI with pentapeptide repeats
VWGISWGRRFVAIAIASHFLLPITAVGLITPAASLPEGLATDVTTSERATRVPASRVLARDANVVMIKLHNDAPRIPAKVSAVSPSNSPSPVLNSSTPNLDERKLRQEIRQLEIANRDAESIWPKFAAITAWVTALAAVTAVVIGWAKQREDMRLQKEKDRELRTQEALRQFESSFASTLANLSSESRSLQASAAATLLVFAGPKYSEFRERVLRIAVVNLQMRPSEPVQDLLTEVVAGVLMNTTVGDLKKWRVNLSRCKLQGLTVPAVQLPDVVNACDANLTGAMFDDSDLWKAQLSRAILAEASCRRANLGQASIMEADLKGVNFSGARLMSANLRASHAQYGIFRGAKLQSAHFDNADLRGARFEGANIDDAYFLGAKLDRGALDSLGRTENLRRAHFDTSVRDALAI